MSTSTVPEALDALVALLSDALDGVEVHDGAPVKYVRPKWVAVGYSPDDEVNAVENWTQEARGLGQQGREERYDVVCSLGSSTGGLAMKPLRDEVFALLAAVENTLRAHGDLTGTVRFAEFTAGAYRQGRNEDENGRGRGLAAGVDFRISVQARV